MTVNRLPTNNFLAVLDLSTRQRISQSLAFYDVQHFGVCQSINVPFSIEHFMISHHIMLRGIQFCCILCRRLISIIDQLVEIETCKCVWQQNFVTLKCFSLFADDFQIHFTFRNGSFHVVRSTIRH